MINRFLTDWVQSAATEVWRDAVGESRLINRNVMATRGRTSMRLEPELWDALEDICHREGITLAEAMQRIEATAPGAGEGGRTSAVRVHIVSYFRAAATEAGHRDAGHGLIDEAA